MSLISRMSRLFIMTLLCLAAVATVFTPRGAAAQDTTKADATLRIVHASPGAPAVDVLLDGQPFATNLAFATATDYAPMPEGKYKLQVVPTGQGADSAVVEQDVQLDSGQAYIFSVQKPLNDIEGKLYQVDLDAVDSGKARVRVVHVSPNAGDVTVAVTGGDDLFKGVGEFSTTDYKDVDAGAYSLDVKKDDQVVYTASNLDIKAGRVYDIFAIGEVANQTFQLLPLVTNVNRPCNEVLGIDGDANSACVRVVHASPGSPAVDVYVNGSPAVQNLAFGSSTDFVAIPTGDKVKIQVTATGAAVDNAVINDDIDFDAGQAYEIVATGALDDIKATKVEVDLTPLPEGQARIRVIHASPDAGKVSVVVAQGPTLFDGVSFRDATNYQVVDAGDYKLQVKTGDDTIALAADATLEAGQVYDAVAVGRADDNTLALLLLTAPASVREGGVATPETGGTPESVGTVEATEISSPDADTTTETQAAGAPTPTPAG